MKYGMLEIVKEVGRTSKGGIRQVLVKCDCGKEKVVRLSNVKSGNTKSCGCNKNKPKHGMTGTFTYSKWIQMHSRCHPNFRNRHRYYDRGISVCPEWEKFEQFYADMGECPEGLELDRIDNDQGYSKDNCRWVDKSLNERNKSATKNVSWSEHAKRWRAYVQHKGKFKHLGYHDEYTAAVKTYNEFAKQHGYPLRAAAEN